MPKESCKKWIQTTLDAFVVVCKQDDASIQQAATTECLYTSIVWNIGDLSVAEGDMAVCACTKECGKNCKNRRHRIECNPGTCRFGGACTNHPWAVYDALSPVLAVRATGCTGFGVYAGENIGKGALVCEYVGETIDVAEKERRSGVPGCEYFMEYGEEKVIDARYFGNVSRFCNHGCNPNAIAEEWIVDGVYRVGIMAIRDIHEGEEVTFDYGSEYSFEECLCVSCLEGKTSRGGGR